jgi:hypothetical protein
VRAECTILRATSMKASTSLRALSFVHASEMTAGSASSTLM